MCRNYSTFKNPSPRHPPLGGWTDALPEDVDEGAEDEHGDLEGKVVPPQQRHHREENAVGAQNHVAIEGERFHILARNL